MNDRQIRTFLNVAEQKSFSKAAAISYLSVTALISQMNTLEKDLGMTLFNKSTHGVTLTREGELFLDAATKLVEIYDNAVAESKRISETYTMKIGLLSPQGELVRAFIMRYQSEHPEVEVSFATINDDEAVDALMDGRAQIIFTPEYSKYDKDQVEFIKVSETNYNVSVSVKHELAKKAFISVTDLVPYELNIYDCSEWKVDPVSFLKDLGVHVSPMRESFDRTVFLNKILAGEMFLTVGMVPGGSTLMTAKIPTDIYAGNFGFMIRKDADEKVRSFVEEYMKN